MNRSQLLDAAKQIVTENRNSTYGEPENLFAAIDLAWKAMALARDGRDEGPVDVCLRLAALKLIRAAANPSHIDSLTDLAGYASIAAEIAAENKA